jgi:hypothetical protein
MMQSFFQDIQIEKRIMAEYVGEVKGVDLSHFDSLRGSGCGSSVEVRGTERFPVPQ